MFNMEGPDSSTPPSAALPHDVSLRVLSLLPPNALALDGRLTCKAAAQHFSAPHHRTAGTSQPLPRHADMTAVLSWWLEGAQAALQEVTFRRKLLLLSRAAASGCEANVKFALQLLQPHAFPELLQTDHYRRVLQQGQQSEAWLHENGQVTAGFDKYEATEVGTAAVESGLARLLPSLEQRCPGLLDPGATLEAAACHLDLAGLRAACEVVGRRLRSSVQPRGADSPGLDLYRRQEGDDQVHRAWCRITAAAARSPGPDAIAKMDWAVALSLVHSPMDVLHANHYGADAEDVCGAALVSGDVSRLRWLRQQFGFEWNSWRALKQMMRHSRLDFIRRLEAEGGYLPPAGDEAWHDEEVVEAAAGSPRDSLAKLRWLAERGAALGARCAVERACHGGGCVHWDNMEALQLLMEHWHLAHSADHGPVPADALPFAVMCATVQAVSWLHQAGGVLEDLLYPVAAGRGSAPLVRWLLEAGCPRGRFDVADIVHVWPCGTAADGERLVEVVRLLTAAGWPLEREGEGGAQLLSLAAQGDQPWCVWRELLQLLPSGCVPFEAAMGAAATGCQATLEALVHLGTCKSCSGEHVNAWYAAAAANGDQGTLDCLRRLGVPLGDGVLTAAVRQGAPLPALRWLMEQGAPVGHQEEDLLGEATRSSIYVSDTEWEQVRAWLQGLPGRAGGSGRPGDRGEGSSGKG